MEKKRGNRNEKEGKIQEEKEIENKDEKEGGEGEQDRKRLMSRRVNNETGRAKERKEKKERETEEAKNREGKKREGGRFISVSYQEIIANTHEGWCVWHT